MQDRCDSRRVVARAVWLNEGDVGAMLACDRDDFTVVALDDRSVDGGRLARGLDRRSDQRLPAQWQDILPGQTLVIHHVPLFTARTVDAPISDVLPQRVRRISGHRVTKPPLPALAMPQVR